MSAARGRVLAQVGCLAVILAARTPALSGTLGIVALVATMLATMLAFAPQRWTVLVRARGLLVPGAIGLLLLPASPQAPLAFLPAAVVALFLVLFLHLSITAGETRAPRRSGGGARSPSVLRWLLPGSLMGLAVGIPLALPWLLPTPLAVLHELPLWGPLLAIVPVAALGVGGRILFRALRAPPRETSHNPEGTP